MNEEKIEAMKRAWDRILLICEEEDLRLEDIWHLLKSMTAWLEDFFGMQ